MYHDFFRNAMLFLPQFFPFSGFPCKKSNKMRINFCSSRHRVFPLFSKVRFFRKNAPPAESGRGINILKNFFQNEGVSRLPKNGTADHLEERACLEPAWRKGPAEQFHQAVWISCSSSPIALMTVSNIGTSP